MNKNVSIPKEKNNYTYILRCCDGSFYCGWTNDLVKRLTSHNTGTGGKYTRSRCPVELVWYTVSETKEQAMRLEFHIKRLRRSQKEKLVSGTAGLEELLPEAFCFRQPAAEERTEKMNTIFYRGNIHTLDRAYPKCSALAVKNGVIMAMGSDEEILKMATDKTRLIDLEGRLMVPGFTDTHMHLLYYAQQAEAIDLSQVTSFEEVKQLFAARLQELPAGSTKWINGAGFNQDRWTIKQIPTRKDLDEISAEVPITIRRACYHITVCNTRAMELMGLMNEDAATTQVAMGFYPDGSPDGLLKEDSQNLVTSAQPQPSLEEIQQMILNACTQAAAQGITEVHSDDFKFIPGEWGQTVMAAYQTLSSEGRLPIRVYQQCSLWDMDSLQNFLAAGYRTGDDFGFYRVGPLKLIADGSLGAHTAWLRQPYFNDPDTCGLPNMTDQKIYQLMKTGHSRGMQIAVHCIGDAALQQSLDTLERIQQEHPRSDCRHGIVHCQIMDRQQQERFRRQNLLAYVQPVFVESDMHIVDACVGPELAPQTYNWRRFIDLGVHMSGGSDCPVEAFDILPNMEYAVTRASRQDGRTWYPENAVTLEEALRMFTEEGAYTSFSEQVRGTLTVGKYADLVVLDRDIFAIPPAEIHAVKPVLTMVGGKVAWEA